MRIGLANNFAMFLRRCILAAMFAQSAQPVAADISFSYGFPGFNLGYGHYGHHGYHSSPRFHFRHGYALPYFRGGYGSYSHRPYRYYRPRRFYRPHRFHRHRRH